MLTLFCVPRRVGSRVLPSNKYTRFIFDDWCLAKKTYHFVITFVLNQTCRCLYKWRREGQMSKSPSQAFKIQTSTAVPTQNRGSEAPLRWGPRVLSLVSKYTLPNTKDTSSETKYTLLCIYQIHLTTHQIHTPKNQIHIPKHQVGARSSESGFQSSESSSQQTYSSVQVWLNFSIKRRASKQNL